MNWKFCFFPQLVIKDIILKLCLILFNINTSWFTKKWRILLIDKFLRHLQNKSLRDSILPWELVLHAFQKNFSFFIADRVMYFAKIPLGRHFPKFTSQHDGHKLQQWFLLDKEFSRPMMSRKDLIKQS